MVGVLASIIVVAFIGIVWFPESFGRDSRRIHDKFMQGWNGKDIDKH